MPSGGIEWVASRISRRRFLMLDNSHLSDGGQFSAASDGQSRASHVSNHKTTTAPKLEKLVHRRGKPSQKKRTEAAAVAEFEGPNDGCVPGIVQPGNDKAATVVPARTAREAAVDALAGDFLMFPDKQGALYVAICSTAACGKQASGTRTSAQARIAVVADGDPKPLVINATKTFVPTPLQARILKALTNQALAKQALANGVCSGEGSRLYRNDGIKELMELGLVKNRRGVGYYRPDAPPPGAIELP